MKEEERIMARERLAAELVRRGCRKTPERFAILDVLCQINLPLAIDQLSDMLQDKHNMMLSRATLYNTLNLFEELKFVVKQQIGNKTCYTPCMQNKNHCWQVCSVCGKTTEIKSQKIAKVLDAVKIKGFAKDGYQLYFHGVCVDCRKALRVRKQPKHKENKIKSDNSKRIKTNNRNK